ncbi:TPA: PhzF family phenazine biosynthesis protein, partial [Enterococcus faecium]|nr:PhzF family phenazine biosynthesis protein [Enterococcus faecium]
MNLDYYVVDAFADEVFKGNPAAVYVLEEWLPEGTMQKIAIENNLSETAFTVKKNQEFELRWFTPDREIDLCGHATLATAFVLFNYYKIPDETIKFSTQSGNLFVTR